MDSLITMRLTKKSWPKYAKMIQVYHKFFKNKTHRSSPCKGTGIWIGKNKNENLYEIELR